VSPLAAQGTVDQAVYVNGTKLSAAAVEEIEKRLGIRAKPGRYWYDTRSGLVGPEGQGATGAVPAGLRYGGRLKTDASGGKSGVFINGRQLTGSEVTYLRALLKTPIRPARYWLDANGDAGEEGKPAIVNLARLIREQQKSAGSAAPARRPSVLGTFDRTGAHVLSDGSVIFPSTDWSRYGGASR
jgi:hypothetical protein